MARIPTDTQVEQFTDADQENRALEEIRSENNAVAAADAVIMGSFDAIKALGRIEAANFFTTVGDKLIAETAIQIRESKKFKGLPYQDAEGNLRHVGDFSEFCRQFLGKSYSRVMELVGNYNTLGSDLYEKAEKLGFRQRDYNALKALPADDRQIIAQAIESESLDNALDMMQQMAAKHYHEKEAAKKQHEELKATLEAKDAVTQKKQEELTKKDRMIDGLNERLALHERKALTATPDEKAAYARNAFSHASLSIKACIETDLRAALSTLMDAEGNHVQVAAACILELMRELRVLRDEFRLPHTINDEAIQNPTWQAVLKDLDEQEAGSEA